MKRTVSVAAAFVCAASFGAFAQSPSTTTSSSSSTTAGADKITVTGCLESNSARSTTGNSATDASSKMGDYILMTSPASSSTTDTTASAGRPTSTTATAGTSGSMNSGASYVLDGRDSELKNHVGHRIEVTGTVENHDGHMAGSSATSTTASGGTASNRMSNNGEQTLKVSSVRMISANCSAK